MPITPDNRREEACCSHGINCQVCIQPRKAKLAKKSKPDNSQEKTLAEFDKYFFVEQEGWSKEMGIPTPEMIKKFLRSALNAQREEIREKVNKLQSYNDSRMVMRKDVLDLLSPNNKDEVVRPCDYNCSNDITKASSKENE